jgi:acetylserotonin O-methyltransferase
VPRVPHTCRIHAVLERGAVSHVGELEEAIREGSNRWQPTFGLQAGELFDYFFRTEEAKRDFLLGMHGFGQISSPAVVRAFDLSRFTKLVDLGGATGHLANAAREAYPNLSVALMELPPVVEFARDLTGASVELIAGDFFKDPLPPADLYALSRILHDWGEEKIRTLLSRIHAALPAGRGLLIAEMLLDDDKRGPVDAHMQSLNMLVCTEGRERSLAEYQGCCNLLVSARSRDAGPGLHWTRCWLSNPERA